MEQVYLLWFTVVDDTLTDGEETLLIGVYSSLEKVQEAQGRVEKFNGFKDHKQGFEINAKTIDEDNWTAGFSLV